MMLITKESHLKSQIFWTFALTIAYSKFHPSSYFGFLPRVMQLDIHLPDNMLKCMEI